MEESTSLMKHSEIDRFKIFLIDTIIALYHLYKSKQLLNNKTGVLNQHSKGSSWLLNEFYLRNSVYESVSTMPNETEGYSTTWCVPVSRIS